MLEHILVFLRSIVQGTTAYSAPLATTNLGGLLHAMTLYLRVQTVPNIHCKTLLCRVRPELVVGRPTPTNARATVLTQGSSSCRRAGHDGGL